MEDVENKRVKLSINDIQISKKDLCINWMEIHFVHILLGIFGFHCVPTMIGFDRIFTVVICFLISKCIGPMYLDEKNEKKTKTKRPVWNAFALQNTYGNPKFHIKYISCSQWKCQFVWEPANMIFFAWVPNCWSIRSYEEGFKY